MARTVSAEVEPKGRFYVITVQEDDGTTVAGYTAGNSVLESQGYLSPDSPQAASVELMETYARTTADQMAEEFGATFDGEVSRWEFAV